MLKTKLILLILISLGITFFILALKSESVKLKSSDIQLPAYTSTNDKSHESSKPEATLTASKNKPSRPTPSLSPTPQASTTNNSSPTPSSTPSPTIQAFQVNLSVTGSPSITINVPEGSNQCDVLSKALEQGKISSLNMQYDKTYETYAVYQINGIGKENSVWWVYTVNGQSPPQGCSYIKANNGDSIEWKYIGS